MGDSFSTRVSNALRAKNPGEARVAVVAAITLADSQNTFIIWFRLKKPRKYGLSWTINWICIIIGVLIMTLSPIFALRNIIVSAKNYKFFS
ncbi:hypothetical protein HN51_066570 [Arachis hypogaea]